MPPQHCNKGGPKGPPFLSLLDYRLSEAGQMPFVCYLITVVVPEITRPRIEEAEFVLRNVQ
jgi:hypothetical protein